MKHSPQQPFQPPVSATLGLELDGVRFYAPEEAAELLRLTPQTLANWRTQGEGPRWADVVGVAVVGHPQARMLQDGYTCEVLRCATDGSRNASSMLYAACWRAARSLGYRRLVTYNHPPESGASLRGAAFRVVAQTKAQHWGRPSRPRVDELPLIEKARWVRDEDRA